MARSHIAAALLAATFALVLIFQLIAQFGLPELDFWRWKSQGESSYGHGHPQMPFTAGLQGDDLYLLGVGKADITGPVVEINLMGYADPNQVGTGLRQRLYSRAFIVGDTEKPEDRFVYLVLDTQSGDTAVRHGILQGLKELGPEYNIYGRQNVAVTGTHSHSGPGAWLNYLLPQITSKGFNRQSYEAIVQGALLSITRAHQSLARGRLRVGQGKVKDANINRSLYAYLANPKEEREAYGEEVDKEMTMINFIREKDKKSMGVLTWFPVHGTSMLGNNTLITGDNKGVAAYLFEQNMVGADTAADGFVAGFSQANVGDTSPNVLGAYCEDGTDSLCKLEDSTCGNRSQACHGRGPFYGRNDGGTDSCFEIGKRQFKAAKDIFEGTMVGNGGSKNLDAYSIRGSTVQSLHVYRSMPNLTFTHPNGSTVRTCSAALGYSFAAGTSDGPGAFDFRQNNPGEPGANPFWARVRNFLHTPTEDQIACQSPKPILLDVGETTSPYDWSPNVVDLQLLRVGQLVIIVSPGEATTMAGRRWKSAISDAALQVMSVDRPVVVLGGPANSYTHYITTEEEYGIQRYEGASTLYGPHTLNAYINLTVGLMQYLTPKEDLPVDELGPSPPVNTNRSLSFITGVVYDRAPLFKSFGDVVSDVHTSYPIQANTNVSARFVGANPRNNLRLEETFAMVQRKRQSPYHIDPKNVRSEEEWETILDDKDWHLVFRWTRTSSVLATSEVEITWELTGKEEPGTYRILYFGDEKQTVTGTIKPFAGKSKDFKLEA